MRGFLQHESREARAALVAIVLLGTGVSVIARRVAAPAEPLAIAHKSLLYLDSVTRSATVPPEREDAYRLLLDHALRATDAYTAAVQLLGVYASALVFASASLALAQWALQAGTLRGTYRGCSAIAATTSLGLFLNAIRLRFSANRFFETNLATFATDENSRIAAGDDALLRKELLNDVHAIDVGIYSASVELNLLIATLALTASASLYAALRPRSSHVA